MSGNFEFEIRRLVLVDSAGFCYVDLPVDDHAILLGDGNLGKSSLLNSLRLFLLPENNFKNSRHKFAFSTPKRDGFYDNEESYNHYFPSKYSFLILEVASKRGGSVATHCQILHRSSGHLAYERIFTPLPYDKIQHLFWNGNDDEDGIGYRVDELTSSSVFKALKALDKHTISVKEPAKLKSLLYENEFLSEAAMRYSVFPMAEREDARIESLRTLILLLFDMNASSEPVAHAVANIIEADKKFVDDVLDFNIEQFLDKHNDLKQQDIDLTKVENLTDKFNQLKLDFDQYRSLDDCELHFAAFYQQLTASLTELKQQLALSSQAVGEAQAKEKEQGKIYKTLSDDNKKLTGEANQLRKQQTSAQSAVDKAEGLLVGYPDMPVKEVLEWIDEDISDNQSKLAALENESQKAKRISQLMDRVTANTHERDKRQANIDNQHFSLEQQLPDKTWKVLTALNKKLALLNPTRELTEQEFQAFVQFSELFETDNDSAHLFGERFMLQTGSITRDDERMVQNLNAEINADNRELQQLQQGHDNAINKANDIQRLKREIQQAKDEAEVIQKLDYYRQSLKELQQPLQDADVALNANKEKLTQEETVLHQFNAEHVKLKAERDHLQTKVNLQTELDKRSKHYLTTHPRLQAAIQQAIEHEPMALVEVTLEQLAQNLQKVSDLGSKLLLNLREFITEQVIEDEHGIFAESPGRKSIIETFKLLQDAFYHLPTKRNVLSEQVRTHNESVQGYTNILQKNYQHIKRFEQQLNRDFAEIEVNDLSGIEVNIHISKRFENLVMDTNKIDLLSNEMLPEQFYQRLEVFAQEFFKASEVARLTMDKIVVNLSYRTRKKDQQQWQTKQQSNSTTALINLKLVQILLGKLRAAGCSLMFPLVLDEVATVDVNQFDWLLDDIKQSGFNLFAASTHSASSELVYKIGRHHQLGEMRTAKPYSAERAMVYWGGAEFIQPLDEVMANQPQLFDMLEQAHDEALDGETS